MGEMKPTKGEWRAKQLGGYDNPGWVVVWPDKGGTHMRRLDYQGNFTEADAILIAEAGTVFHSTGLSPVQLVEMVRELKAALQDAEEYISGHTPTNSWGLLDRREDADRCETLEKVRAALAKCEGVK